MSDASPVPYTEALQIIGGLSQPSKMPWWAWSISATECPTGRKLAEIEGSVCSNCYALKGRYLFPNVVEAHARRLEATKHPRFVDAFVTVLTNVYGKTRKRRADGRIENRFRWFDSGDLQSLDMLVSINEIASRTPFIDHWLPTREFQIVQAFLGKHVKSENLLIRMSYPMVGGRPSERPFGLPFATVGSASSGVHQCPALADQGNRCLECDTCWRDVDVNYPIH